MAKPKVIGFIANEEELQRVEELVKATGLTTSDVLRALVRSAELEPVEKLRPVARLGREQIAA